MDDHLSTKQVGWILEKSAGSIREMIQSGEIEAVGIASRGRRSSGWRVTASSVRATGASPTDSSSASSTR